MHHGSHKEITRNRGNKEFVFRNKTKRNKNRQQKLKYTTTTKHHDTQGCSVRNITHAKRLKVLQVPDSFTTQRLVEVLFQEIQFPDDIDAA